MGFEEDVEGFVGVDVDTDSRIMVIDSGGSVINVDEASGVVIGATWVILISIVANGADFDAIGFIVTGIIDGAGFDIDGDAAGCIDKDIGITDGVKD